MSKKSSDQETPVVNFDYIKSNFFRVIHADGAVGGLTPTGNIQLNFWSQRRPIPKQVSHPIHQDDAGNEHLGEEIKREQRDAVVREVESGIVMDLGTAIAIRDWLQRQIQELASRVVVPEQEQDEVDT